MKPNHTSTNTFYVEQGVELTDIPRPSKFLSSPATKASTGEKFILRYYLLLIVAFSNNLVDSALNSETSTFLFTSIGVLIFLIVFSLFSLISLQKIESFYIPNIFSHHVLLFLTSICLVFIDPNVMKFIIQLNHSSYLSSMQTLILLIVISYKYSQNSKKLLIFIIAMGIISFTINIITRQEKGKAIFEFIVLISFVLSGRLCVKVSSKTEKNPPTTGVEEITHEIDKILEKIIDINENPETKESLSDIIKQLTTINLKIRLTPNIYTVITKPYHYNIDEQDKIFIEQACFDSNSLSHPPSPSSETYKKYNETHKKYTENYYGMSELMGFLKNIGKEWNFNTFFISDCSGSTPLQIVGQYTIKRFGLNEIFSISEPTLDSFLRNLEKKYEKNHYHNSTHAADVMCSMSYLIQNSVLVDHITSLELLACILSALAHDVGHPGKSNRFMVLSKNEISVVYNDISVLEMMHSSLLFQILKDQDSNILSSFSDEKWSIIRKDIIGMILATDMGKHFELLGQFKAKYLNTEFHDFGDAETRLDLFKIITKAADIGHTAKNSELHER